VNDRKPVSVNLQVADGVAHAAMPTQRDFQAWVEAALAEADHSAELPLVVALRIAGEAESAALNSDYRGKISSTNVLAFPAPPPMLPAEEIEELELGDLVVCLAVAEREAAAQNKSLPQHLAHLTVHGTLHLLGYDHQQTEDADAMESLERAVLEGLGQPNPYA